MSENIRVFVYGTLRPSLRERYGFYGGVGPKSWMPVGTKVTDGTVRGRIYPLSDYVPGVILDNNQDAPVVVGEVVEVTEKELIKFDSLESGYDRVETIVSTPQGELMAFIYQTKPKIVERMKPVASGDWAKHLVEVGFSR